MQLEDFQRAVGAWTGDLSEALPTDAGPMVYTEQEADIASLDARLTLIEKVALNIVHYLEKRDGPFGHSNRDDYNGDGN